MQSLDNLKHVLFQLILVKIKPAYFLLIYSELYRANRKGLINIVKWIFSQKIFLKILIMF